MTVARSYKKSSFETLGFYPLVLAPFFFFFSLFFMAVYVGHVIGILLFGLLSSFFLIGSEAKITISEDGIFVKRMVLGTSYWNFDEVRFKAGGRVLAYGGIYGGWIMPLRWRECARSINSSRYKGSSVYEKGPSGIPALIYLLAAPLILFIIGRVTAYFKLTILPSVWALVWASGMTLSVIAYFNTAPVQTRIGQFNKKQTSIVIGLTIGLITFLSVLLIYMATRT